MSELGTSLSINYFPSQKVADAKKNEKWFKENIEAGISLTWWNQNTYANIRNSRREKVINYDLRRNIIHKEEIEKVVNPYKIAEDKDFPATYRNYPILNQNLNILIGEERRRLFNPVAVIISEDFWNEKQQEIDGKFNEFVQTRLMSNNTSDEQTKQELQEFNKWRLTYRDRRERMVQQVMEYGLRCGAPGGLPLKEEFSRGFEDLLTVAEEIYVADIIAGEPILRKGNPLNFHTLRGGQSYKIEDSDIIIEDGYLPLGEVIDRYHDYLSSADITDLEAGYNVNRGGATGSTLLNPPASIGEYIDVHGADGNMADMLLANRSGINLFGGFYDREGNVRVTRVVWRSFREIGFLDYIDEFGEKQTELVPAGYKPNTAQGEVVRWRWVSEWMEGTKIGYDKYVKMQPIPFQARHRDNPSICSPGIVGTIYNVNSSKGESLVDVGKSWQYLFNSFMYRLELFMIKNKGKIGKLPMHLIPQGWTVDKALYYAEMMNWLPVDAFNEGVKGMSRGKLAGGMNESSPVIDMEMGSSIQHTFVMLEFIKRNLDDLTGITEQRRGAVDNRETKGGVEMALSQSSITTEKWFSVHDNTKIRALKAFVECAKVAWKDKKLKRPYILDDGSQAILDFDGDMFAEYEYGIDITSTSSDMEMMATLKSISQSFAQKGGALSVVMSLFRTKDPASLQRKLEAYEAEQAERESQAQQSELQMRQTELDQEAQLEREKMENENVQKQLDRENEIYLAEIKALGFSKETDADADGIPDVIEQGKLALEQTKSSYDQSIKERELQLKQRQAAADSAVKNKELELKTKELEVKKQDSINKVKIARMNKNRHDK